MDGHPIPLSLRFSPASPFRMTRRQTLRAMGGGIAALAAGAAGLTLPARQASAKGSIRLTNPSSRVLLPGEAGLHDFGLDFSLTGPPAVFFTAGDTPGWSSDVKSSIGQFVFGYAATLAQSNVDAGRSVQVCVHQGFPSSADAEIAWTSLTAALASRSRAATDAKVRTLDLVELIIVDGESILASVSSGQLSAIVLASRSGSDLVTVAIADFTGMPPSADEALKLVEEEGKKVQRSREIERTDLRSAFDAQWTPGFQLGTASGAPFFAWPTQLERTPVAITGESPDQFQLRQLANAEVTHQSHVEGPFWEANPAFPSHGLFYSAQTNFFDTSRAARRHHSATGDRLRGSMPDATIVEVHIGRKERRYAYETHSSYGAFSAVTLHAIVQDGDFPLSLSAHIVAVPLNADAPALNLDEVIDRLDGLLKEMRDGLSSCLVQPEAAPLVVSLGATL